MSADVFRIAARHSANPDAALYRRDARERTGLAAREAWSRYQGAQVPPQCAPARAEGRESLAMTIEAMKRYQRELVAQGFTQTCAVLAGDSPSSGLWYRHPDGRTARIFRDGITYHAATEPTKQSQEASQEGT